MTKDKKTARMSTQVDKRRGAGSATGGGGTSAAHVLRASSSSTAPQNPRNSIIAPPPRAQLTGQSSSNGSPSPEDAGHDGSVGVAPLPKPDSGVGAGGGGGSGASSVVPTSNKEKDQRIANLEREMALMETEFQRELDKLSQNESETATFWQAKHSALNQQFLRTDTELRLLRTELELREGEREELREGLEALRLELWEKEAEIKDLRRQVRGLKEWVSTSTRTGGQTSDEVFGDGMARLGNSMQNWVIVNFRRAKLDLSKTDDATVLELQQLVPMYDELSLSSKVHLLQSLVSQILVNEIFESYFVGLSDEQANHFRDMEKILLSYSSPEAVNQWRSSTLAMLSRDANQTMQALTLAISDKVVRRVNRILDTITDATGSETRDVALKGLVNSSIELSRLLVVQKAVLRVYMPEILPHQRTTFDPALMEDIGGEDEDGLAQREISCVTFPGIIKKGDENGGQLQFQNVIAKARVLCSPE